MPEVHARGPPANTTELHFTAKKSLSSAGKHQRDLLVKRYLKRFRDYHDFANHSNWKRRWEDEAILP